MLSGEEINELIARRLSSARLGDMNEVEKISIQLSAEGIWIEFKSDGAVAWHRRSDRGNESNENYLALRQIALDHAVRTHEHSVDENLIVKAAQVYLAFLKGDETIPAPGEVQHHPV